MPNLINQFFFNCIKFYSTLLFHLALYQPRRMRSWWLQYSLQLQPRHSLLALCRMRVYQEFCKIKPQILNLHARQLLTHIYNNAHKFSHNFLITFHTIFQIAFLYCTNCSQMPLDHKFTAGFKTIGLSSLPNHGWYSQSATRYFLNIKNCIQ